MVDKPCILAKIIDEHSGPISKIILRSGKKRRRYNPALSNRSFVLDIKINSFSIPGNNGLSLPEFLNTIETLITVRNDGGAGNDILMVILLQRIRILVSLLIDLLELFNGMVLELAGIDLIQTVMWRSTHAVSDAEEFIVRYTRGLLGEEVFGAVAL